MTDVKSDSVDLQGSFNLLLEDEAKDVAETAVMQSRQIPLEPDNDVTILRKPSSQHPLYTFL